jgi:putative intracellular protease/amidase
MRHKWMNWITGIILCAVVGKVMALSNPPSADQSERPRILMIVTGHGTFPESGEKTGLWLAEFAEPWQIFIEAGCEVVIAVPGGGEVPIDPRSTKENALPENPGAALVALRNPLPLSEVDGSRFDAVFFPGGHGTMFDFPNNPPVQETVEYFLSADRPVALVCHGPAALVGAETEDGQPVVKGRRVTAFTNEEEEAAELTEQVPFLLESRLEELGATVETAANFAEHVVVDGRLITGQNPASSAKAAKKLLEQIRSTN